MSLLAAAVRLELPRPRRGEGRLPLASVQLLEVLRVLVRLRSLRGRDLGPRRPEPRQRPQILASRAWASGEVAATLDLVAHEVHRQG